jgi:hypothetical protein
MGLLSQGQGGAVIDLDSRVAVDILHDILINLPCKVCSSLPGGRGGGISLRLWAQGPVLTSTPYLDTHLYTPHLSLRLCCVCSHAEIMRRSTGRRAHMHVWTETDTHNKHIKVSNA